MEYTINESHVAHLSKMKQCHSNSPKPLKPYIYEIKSAKSIWAVRVRRSPLLQTKPLRVFIQPLRESVRIVEITEEVLHCCISN